MIFYDDVFFHDEKAPRIPRLIPNAHPHLKIYRKRNIES